MLQLQHDIYNIILKIKHQLPPKGTFLGAHMLLFQISMHLFYDFAGANCYPHVTVILLLCYLYLCTVSRFFNAM